MNNITSYDLTEEDVLEVLGNYSDFLHISEELTVEQIKKDNPVYRISSGKGVFFLKMYTKFWYPSIESTSDAVNMEKSTWEILSSNGLSVPEVIIADESTQNDFGRPFIITRMLQGESFTSLIKNSDEQMFSKLCIAVGRYLRRMHSITFKYPGFIYGSGPQHAPTEIEGGLWCWTKDNFKKYALDYWKSQREMFSEPLISQIEDFYKVHESDIGLFFNPPRFVHGDCHAHQFYLIKEYGEWNVSGVLDMERAQSGDCTWDLLKLGLEMSGKFSYSTKWWEHIFKGYGNYPVFWWLKLQMLAAWKANYACIGGFWNCTREQILTHILNSVDFDSLYDLRNLDKTKV